MQKAISWQSYAQNHSVCLQRSLYDCSMQAAGMAARMLMLNVEGERETEKLTRNKLSMFPNKNGDRPEK